MMSANTPISCPALRACVVAVGLALLAGPQPLRAEEPPAQRELIPGADNMTPAQREDYRKRMQAAASAEEKAKIRGEYLNAAKEPDKGAALVGDPGRGEKLHRSCFYCHGIERYTAPVTYAAASFIDSVLRASGLSDLPPNEAKTFKGKAKSITDLRDGVNRRNDYLNPKMNAQEVEDVVAYLNATYYKFPP